MSPAEFNSARKVLGMSTAALAEWLGLELPNGERLIRAWESGKKPISGPAARAMHLAIENTDLKQSVIAFAGPWADEWARIHELPDNHLHSEHYDLLERCGARMAEFIRVDTARSPKSDRGL